MTGATHGPEAAVAGLADAEPSVPGAQAQAPSSGSVVARGRWPYRAAVAVLVVGVLVTAALALVSNAQYTRNEKRLLDLRMREVGALLSGALPNIQTPLASAAALADATNGDPKKFMQFVTPYVGAPPTHQFVSISLWRLGAAQRGPVAVVGSPPALSASSPAAAPFFARAAHALRLSVIGLTPPTLLRLGYAFTTAGAGNRYAAYGESAVPGNRRSRLERNSAFSDLDYALYLGNSRLPGNLLVTSLERRGETLDHGLARLRGAATASDGSLGELLARLMSELRLSHSDDDVAIVGVRWKA